MKSTMVRSVVGLGLMVAIAAPALAASGGHHHKSSSRLFGPSMIKGVVKFDEVTAGGKKSQWLRVQVKGAEAHEDLDVAVNGVVIGWMTTNSNGKAKLTLRRDKHHDDLPNGFPTLDTGDIVTVGESGGVFFDDHDHKAQKFEVSGEFGDDGAPSGSIEYSEKSKLGVLSRKFEVEVDHAVPGELLDISVNGSSVGTIVIGDDGEGELVLRTGETCDDDDEVGPLPNTFPSLHAGDVVMVGSTAVTLVAGDDDDQSGPDGDDGDDGDDDGGSDD